MNRRVLLMFHWYYVRHRVQNLISLSTNVKLSFAQLPRAVRKLQQAIFWIMAIAVLLAPIDRGKFALAFEGESLKPESAENLILKTVNGKHEFKVEVMRTEEELEKGLMFRRYLPANRGMLFDFQSERPISMWMKNTYISLDMIFISREGLVTSIAENAEPLSENIISSNGPVYAVLELNGGTASKIGVKIGDHVINSLFRP
jgi:uncharacterized membrane protein (UPF0127 family)